MSVRLFVALDLPDAVRAALPAPGEGWRRVSVESLHVTLAFLGWRDEEDVPRVVATVSGAVCPVGELAVEGVVLLPPRRPRVMAVRLAGDVAALQASVAGALERAGLYEPEKRHFLPHVTIGRARGREGMPRGAPVPSVEPLRFRAPSVTVYRSRLAPGGAQYEALARFAV